MQTQGLYFMIFEFSLFHEYYVVFDVSGICGTFTY